jgi:uracil-DNA glycosylase family 4
MSESDWQVLVEEVHACRLCPRLVAWREEVAAKKRAAYRAWEYWGKPLSGFGDHSARLLVVGLAPAAHGGNRTGRVFTGDSSGDFLYAALHRYGFANQPTAVHRDDGLQLQDTYIAAVCRCAPPDNKPLPQEMLACRPFLLRELALLPRLEGVVVLGQIAFQNMLAIYRQRGHEIPRLEFGHDRLHILGQGQKRAARFFRAALFEILLHLTQSIPSGICCGLAQFGFDAQQLVVLGHAV